MSDGRIADYFEISGLGAPVLRYLYASLLLPFLLFVIFVTPSLCYIIEHLAPRISLNFSVSSSVHFSENIRVISGLIFL